MSEQSEANNPERCSCGTCGYTWLKGQHGGHSCAQVMEVTIADLRARLAKYEDAEGRPLQGYMPDALAKVGAFLLGEGEIEGHSFGDARPDMDGMFWWRKELRAALAELNPSPASAGEPCECGGSPHTTECLYEHFLAYSGLTDHPLLRYTYFHGADAECEKPSAGGVDGRSAFEALEADCREMFHWVRGCGAYENGVKEIVRRAKARAALSASAPTVRPIATCLRGQFETWAMETEHPVFGYIGSDWLDRGDDPNTYANDYIQGAWVMFQKLAASAPNHSEQVREGYVQVPKEQLDIVLNGLPSIDKTRVMQKLRVMLYRAAAPSAGSHGGDV